MDDFDDFRQFLCSRLEQGTECEVVGEASDGLQAVYQAEKLQPDLILLDLGLPTLNGIKAARRIRQVSPQSKILFVSQNSSSEIAQGALNAGAHGYLVKSDSTVGDFNSARRSAVHQQSLQEPDSRSVSRNEQQTPKKMSAPRWSIPQVEV